MLTKYKEWLVAFLQIAIDEPVRIPTHMWVFYGRLEEMQMTMCGEKRKNVLYCTGEGMMTWIERKDCCKACLDAVRKYCDNESNRML